jgi:hypothetical protein
VNHDLSSLPELPHVISRRSARGLPNRKTDDAEQLTRAIRCRAAAWVDWRSTVAHLVLAGRATCGRDADLWAREQLSSWLAHLDDVTANELADELERDADDVAERLRETRSPRSKVKAKTASRSSGGS